MKDRKALEALIDRVVQPRNFARQNELDLKIALLSFVLEQLKHERNAKADPVTFEEFTQCEVFADIDRLVVAAPPAFNNLGSGTPSIQLQALLLLFLLTHHRERFPVLEIIQLFVEKIRERLGYLDFKKTKTGTTRCFTNTRFAAKVLREYGLLKFTRREAYKTWELSLTGFLVAADVYHKRAQSQDPWSVRPHRKDLNFDLADEIRQACGSIQTYDAFVKRLASLCKPDAAVFEAFKPALEKAFALLEGYWDVMQNPNITQEERQKASLQRVQQLEKEGISDDFYAELSRCIQINELLSEVPAPDAG